MQIQKLFLSVLIMCFVVSCKKKSSQEEIQEQISNLQKYREYISDVSPGIISAHSDVRVVLRQPVEGWTNDMELPSGLFKIKPRVKGKVVALDNQTIAFIHEETLKQDTEYNLSIDLEEIIPRLNIE